MERVRLGKTSLDVSRLGFGGCPMGGHGWGAVDDQKIQDSIALALDHGVNFFDTADTYGVGKSEELLGTTLKQLGKRAIIATKFGIRLDANRKGYYDNSPAWITEALEGSLRRLQVDCIDLYQIHYRDVKVPLDVVLETLERKKDEGKIRYYGLSNPSREELRQAAATRAEALASFQCEYSLANRDHEMLIAEAANGLGLGFLSWGSLGQGILSGNYGRDTRFDSSDRRSRPVYVNFHGEKLEQNLRIVDVLKAIGARIGKTPSAIALRWILDRHPQSVALVGIKNPDQLRGNLGAFGWTLSIDDLKALNAVSNPTPVSRTTRSAVDDKGGSRSSTAPSEQIQ